MADKYQPDASRVESEATAEAIEDQDVQSRRGFLIGLGKWSRAVIVGAVAGGALLTEKPAQAGSWLNRRGCCRGGGWVNGRGGGGGSWANRRGGGWGGSWVNRR